MRAAIDQWFATLPKEVNPKLQSKPSVEPDGATIRPPSARPAPDRARAFARWDKNRDDVLSMEEYAGGLSDNTNAAKRFENFDKNGDGKLSRDEFVTPSRN